MYIISDFPLNQVNKAIRSLVEERETIIFLMSNISQLQQFDLVHLYSEVRYYTYILIPLRDISFGGVMYCD